MSMAMRANLARMSSGSVSHFLFDGFVQGFDRPTQGRYTKKDIRVAGRISRAARSVSRKDSADVECKKLGRVDLRLRLFC
jgi:hypothetical protein